MFNKRHFNFFSIYGRKTKSSNNESVAQNAFDPLKKELQALHDALKKNLPKGYRISDKRSIRSTNQPGRGQKTVTYVDYIWFKIYTDQHGMLNEDGKPQNVFNVTFDSSGISIKMNAFKNNSKIVPLGYIENLQTITYSRKNYDDIASEIISYCQNNATTYANNAKLFASSSGSIQNPPLNMILYGPPGTGKTYNTVNKALEIIDGTNSHDIDRFNELKNVGRIKFTTFHQSMSYEDFIEGIKPKTDSGGKLTYPINNGIFKEFCYEIIKESINPTNKDAVKVGEIQDVITNKSEKESKFEPTEEYEEANQRYDRYVLIIDEINRGNVSQIFGELITLIEDDKRLGMPEAKAYTVTLPYSNEVFSVPKNLYIIGTMNTADRSVEALDTALRRRFSFEEMMPDYNADGMDTKIEDHTLEEILKTINERIEVLKGREQQIGHSYLMKCETPADVKAAFKDKIVPLLQEYFYGDYSQIALVLGPDFVKKINKVNFPSINGVYGPEQNETRYRMLKDTEWKELDLKEALDHLLNKQNQKEQQEDDQTDENS